MEVAMLLPLVCIAIAGAVGGALNAYISDNGFILPKSLPTSTGATILQPGALGNVLLGAVAAVVSWGLYGPFADAVVIGTPKPSAPEVGITLAALAGAILVGVGGAKWLTDQVDKKLLKAATVEAAKGRQDMNVAFQIGQSSPAQAFHLARSLGSSGS